LPKIFFLNFNLIKKKTQLNYQTNKNEINFTKSKEVQCHDFHHFVVHMNINRNNVLRKQIRSSQFRTNPFTCKLPPALSCCYPRFFSEAKIQTKCFSTIKWLTYCLCTYTQRYKKSNVRTFTQNFHYFFWKVGNLALTSVISRWRYASCGWLTTQWA